MTKIISKAEARASGLLHYFTGQPCRRGHVALRKISGHCVECHKLATDKWVESNRDTARERTRNWQKSNRPHIRAYRKANRESENRQHREWVAKQPHNGKFKRQARVESRVRAAKRRLKQAKATLPGYDKELLEIYLHCPLGSEVDHIVPINHPLVCGLHVPWNLQYLTVEENRKKGNSFTD